MRRLLLALLALAVLACGEKPDPADKQGAPEQREYADGCASAQAADELNSRAADPEGNQCHVCADGCEGRYGYWWRDGAWVKFEGWDEEKYADRHEACEDIQAFSFAEQWCSE